MEEKKIELNPFLTNLKKALETGEPNESTQKINEVENQSKNISASEANIRLIKRIENVGYAESVSKEIYEKTQKNNEIEMRKIKNEEEKSLAISNILNSKHEINKTKEELDIVISKIKKKYADVITEKSEILVNLNIDFKTKYGKEEYEKVFGSEKV